MSQDTIEIAVNKAVAEALVAAQEEIARLTEELRVAEFDRNNHACFTYIFAKAIYHEDVDTVMEGKVGGFWPNIVKHAKLSDLWDMLGVKRP